MKNFFLMAHSKESPYFAGFCSAISDALYHEVAGDRQKAEDVLRKRLRSQLRSKHLGDDEALGAAIKARVKRMPRSYWRRRVRHHIPDPATLEADITLVYKMYSKLRDPAHNRPFFNHTHERQFKTSIAYIKKGYLSDPPGMAMYAKLRVTADGLQLYRTLRTSSAVEGYHLHLSRCLAAGAKSAGIHWIDAVRCEFDYVWTVRMLRGAGWFGSAKHYNLQLIDRANAAMLSANAGEAYKDWKETHVPDAMKEAVVRHGVYYAQRAVRMREAAAAAAARKGADEADEGGEEEAGGGGGAAVAAASAPVALVHATDAQQASDDHWMKHARLTLDASDIRAIVADTALHRAAAAAVQSRAAEMGLVLPPEKAGKLLSAVLVKEKANAQLRAFGSLSVLGRVRRPAPSGVARTVVLLPAAPPALAPPATSTVLPLAARAAGRSASFPPVAVPQAPVLPLAPVAAAAPAAAAAAAAAGAGAGVGEAGQAETKGAKAARVKREKRALESPAAKCERANRRAAKRNKPLSEGGRGRYTILK
jgi:hypothetical protein